MNNELFEKRVLYPRVSEIIGKQNEVEMRLIPIDTLANACLRGQKVHEYCTAIVNNLWVTDVEDEYKPYVAAFSEWASNNIDECVHSTTRLYDDNLGFTGEFDMIVRLKDSNKLALIDIKTSSVSSKAWPLQLSAYAHLCKINGYEFEQVLNLHLKKTKPATYEKIEEEKVLVSPPLITAKSIVHEDLTSFWEIFSSAFRCYKYFNTKESK